MGYTAAALSLMLRGFGKPVVLTGSQLPLAAPRTDARQNLLGACGPRTKTELMRQQAVCVSACVICAARKFTALQQMRPTRARRCCTYSRVQPCFRVAAATHCNPNAFKEHLLNSIDLQHHLVQHLKHLKHLTPSTHRFWLQTRSSARLHRSHRARTGLTCERWPSALVRLPSGRPTCPVLHSELFSGPVSPHLCSQVIQLPLASVVSLRWQAEVASQLCLAGILPTFTA